MSHYVVLPRELLNKYNTFAWDEAINKAFQWFKAFMNTTVWRPFQYYYHSKTISAHSDASYRVQSTCLLQEGSPLPLHLNPPWTEMHHTNIERELLVVVFPWKSFKHTDITDCLELRVTTNP